MSHAAEALHVVEPAPGEIGAEVHDIDLKALPAGSPEFGAIRDLIYKHRLVVIRGQSLNEAQYIDFTRKMGRPQIYFQENYHHPDHPEIFVSSNVKEGGRKIGVARTGNYWRTDCSFQSDPLSWTSVYPQIFPRERRGTLYIDMAKVYRNLPDSLRRYVEGKTAVHAGQLRYKVKESDIDCSLKDLLERINREVPPVRHPAVIAHPATGEKALYLNSGFTVRIEGLSHEENAVALAELFAFIEREEHVHNHVWDKGDLIIWDNRLLIHMSSTLAPGDVSKSYRIGIYDGLPFYEGIQA